MIRRLFALVVLAAVAFVGYTYWKSQESGSDSTSLTRGMGEVGQRLQDVALGGAVKTALRLNRNLEPYKLRVEAEEGVITLRGSVPSAELRRQAEEVATAVPEVDQVVNHLEVQAGDAPKPGADERSLGERVDDESLEVQVRVAFSLNRDLKGTDLKVQAFRKQVTLLGQVATPAQRDLALKIAGGTAGATGVADRIEVRGHAEHEDPGNLRARVDQALAGNSHLAKFGLHVKGEGDRLVLRGRVRTEIEKELAGAVAREAAGGPVDNALEVRP